MELVVGLGLRPRNLPEPDFLLPFDVDSTFQMFQGRLHSKTPLLNPFEIQIYNTLLKLVKIAFSGTLVRYSHIIYHVSQPANVSQQCS